MARPRKTKTEPSLSGITLDIWRSDSEHLRWAQQTPVFREILAVLINERAQALSTAIPVTENRLLGRTEGYELAVQVLQDMARPILPQPEFLEPTYEPPEDMPRAIELD